MGTEHISRTAEARVVDVC